MKLRKCFNYIKERVWLVNTLSMIAHTPKLIAYTPIVIVHTFYLQI